MTDKIITLIDFNVNLNRITVLVCSQFKNSIEINGVFDWNGLFYENTDLITQINNFLTISDVIVLYEENRDNFLKFFDVKTDNILFLPKTDERFSGTLFNIVFIYEKLNYLNENDCLFNVLMLLQKYCNLNSLSSDVTLNYKFLRFNSPVFGYV